METVEKKHSKSIRSNPVIWRDYYNPNGVAYTHPGFMHVLIYCNDTFGKENWDFLGGILYFKYEKDAIMFRIRWL